MNKEIRDIRLVFLVFSAFFAFFAYKHYPSPASYILISLAILVICLLTFTPVTLRPLFNIWLKVAHAIGKFNTQILLTIVFIIIFIPVGLFMRLIGRDLMKRMFSEKKSYWEQYKLSGSKDKKRYERQF